MKVKLELKNASKVLENAQVEKGDWIKPCFTSCHTLIYTSFLSLTISLFAEFLGRKKTKRNKPRENTTKYNLFPLFSPLSSRFCEGPGGVFIASERSL